LCGGFTLSLSLFLFLGARSLQLKILADTTGFFSLKAQSSVHIIAFILQQRVSPSLHGDAANLEDIAFLQKTPKP